MTPGQTLYFDVDILENKGKMVEDNVALLKRYKEEGYFIVVLVRGDKGLSDVMPFIDVIRKVPERQSLYQGIGDKTGVLFTKYDKDMRTWFSESVKCYT